MAGAIRIGNNPVDTNLGAP